MRKVKPILNRENLASIGKSINRLHGPAKSKCPRLYRTDFGEKNCAYQP